ncbi:MAG TPA: L,D-transpeptidase [Pelolinea sp.]|nr:L,D-transpeptidase [Pelolinea sp.]
MHDKKDRISRRTFLKQSLNSAGAVALAPYLNAKRSILDNWPQGEMLGRNTVYIPSQLPIRSRPSVDSEVIRYLKEDEVVIWRREVIGQAPIGRVNKRWVETDDGYIYSPSLQEVRNVPNEPESVLPEVNGEKGMWVEVTIPFVPLELVNTYPQSPWLQNISPSLWKLYYSQVIWVDDIRTNENGVIQYRLNELYGNPGDIFWADASAFRVISPEEITPIRPEVENKKIVVNVNQQNLICYEGNNEVYFCQVSTGLKLDPYGNPVDDYATPVGIHWIHRKLISLHMSGGGAAGREDGGWDTNGVGWTTMFASGGVSIHSTFWHNDFGTPKSHGCVNVLPEDAKWIFCWTSPQVAYFPGDITDNTFRSTNIDVIEPLY